MAALAWILFQRSIIRCNGGPDSTLARAIGARDWKGIVSPVCYLAAIPLAFVSPWLSGLLYVAVALMWLVPDRRIEARLGRADDTDSTEHRTA